MPSIFFYISGHGFGHSVRQIEIINALLEAAADRLQVIVRTSAAPWLFRRSVCMPITFLSEEVDTGVVQIDSLRLDARATVERAMAFYAQLATRVRVEAALLRQRDARLVVADAPPLACAAAQAAGIPAFVCGNFTWDWIYREYRDAAPSVDVLISQIEELYALATGAWRLPMHGGFETIDRVEDVPLVARHASPARTRDGLRQELNLPVDSRLALVSFGGYGVRDLPLEQLDCTTSWQVVITTPEPSNDSWPPGVIGIAERAMYERGLQYQDLVRAMDMVISKPGYGIISDCIANHAALLYTPRGRFAEYDVLVREMPRFLRCRLLSMDDFLAGRWKTGLDALAEMAPALEQPRTDGARIVAARILETARL